jgi:hypothetical protein
MMEWTRNQEGSVAYLNRILWTESKLQPIRLALVQWIRVDNLDVHEPSLKVVGLDKCYAGREFIVHLEHRQHLKRGSRNVFEL